MQSESVKREKKPELFEIYLSFQEQGKRLSECLSRVYAIGNKLEDESGSVKDANKPETMPRQPGIITDFNNLLDEFKGSIYLLEQHLSKIERHI